VADRTVSVKLLADTKDYTAGLVRAAAATKALPDEVDRAVRPGMATAGQRAGVAFSGGLDEGVRRADPVVRRAGERSGGVLAQGIRGGLIRNSPLIAAAVGGALAAGAPVALAGATTLFAGIGAVAAAQSDAVRVEWQALWEDIKTGTQADAASLVPVFQNMARDIGSAFELMRPQLQDAFQAVGPQIEILSDSLLRMAQNALPGLVRAVQNGTPAIEGFGSFLEDIGTGLGDFFAILSDHSPAAGRAFAALGDIMAELLPILGELLGQGAELAADILPAVADALGLVRDVLEVVGPALPSIVTGFLAMKAAGAGFSVLGRGVDGLGTAFGGADSKVSKFGKSLGAVGAALPLIGGGIGLLSAALNESERNLEANTALYTSWHQQLAQGGAVAADAAAKFAQLSAMQQDPPWFMRNDVDNGDLDKALRDAAAAAHEYWESLSPLEQAQAKVAEWTDTLAYRLRELGPAHEDTQIAARKLAEWELRAAEAAAELERESSGLTVTLEQAEEAADNLSTAFERLNGTQLSLNAANREWQEGLDEARQTLADTAAGIEGASTSLDITTEAGRRNQEMFDSLAETAGQMADAIYEQTGSYDQYRQTLDASRLELYELRRAYGDTEQQAWAYVDSVLAIPSEVSTQANLNASQVQGEVNRVLGLLKGVPEGVEVNVGVLHKEASLALHQLGYEVRTLPSGEVVVTARDDATPTVQEARKLIEGLDQQVAEPKLTADDQQIRERIAAANELVKRLNNERPKPVASLDDKPLMTVAAGVRAALAVVAAQKPTPQAHMNDTGFKAIYAATMSLVRTLASQRPTPITLLDIAPFTRNAVAANTSLNLLNARVAVPRVLADTKAAHAALDAVQAHINRLQGRTITVTVRGQLPAGFAAGGYTGAGGVHDVAGLVHAGEFVVPQKRVREMGGPQAVAARVGVPITGLRGYAAGGLVHDPQVPVTLNYDTANVDAAIKQAQSGALPGGGGAILGGGAMWQKLFATIKAAFPLARLNSGYRPTNDLHGAGRAVDLGYGSGPGGAGNPGLAAMARWIYQNHGSSTRELIYTGLYDSTPDLKDGRPLNYGAATNAQHTNHVHWAMATGGVIGEPVIGRGLWSGGSYSFGERGPETVLPGVRSREWSGGTGGGGGATLSIDYGKLAAAVAASRSVTIQTSDNPRAIVRALQTEEQRQAALAPAW